jgi:tetratricopeptide (TPR) repeat protein
VKKVFTAGPIRLLVVAMGLFANLAHEGPEHEIEELTERIAKEGESVDLLLQRAVEYQVIRKASEAVKDLERALRLEPQSPTVLRELGRAYFATGKTNEALQTVTQGLSGSRQGADRASLLMVRVEILRARNENKNVLSDIDEAILNHPINAEWYLMRSQVQSALKLTRERVAGLEQGIKATGSGVLQIEWVDALIDDGQHTLALEKIETELNSSRLKSSWLLRRARVRIASGQKEAAKSDLEAALKELNHRIRSASPDPSLLADRGMAYEFLGNIEEARKDYKLAKEKGFADAWVEERIRALK